MRVFEEQMVAAKKARLSRRDNDQDYEAPSVPKLSAAVRPGKVVEGFSDLSKLRPVVTRKNCWEGAGFKWR